MKSFSKSMRRTSLGFTLIEVLVALLILAIGLLGIAALQFKGLRYSNDSFMRSQISFLAYDIADRIRTNTDFQANYIGDYTVPASGTNACTQATGLQSAANATNDLNCWRNSVINALPPGSTANISQTGDLFSVILTWTDREGSAHNVNYTFQP